MLLDGLTGEPDVHYCVHTATFLRTSLDRARSRRLALALAKTPFAFSRTPSVAAPRFSSGHLPLDATRQMPVDRHLRLHEPEGGDCVVATAFSTVLVAGLPAQFVCTSICRGRASSRRGIVSFSTPFCRFAKILDVSKSALSENARAKRGSRISACCSRKPAGVGMTASASI